MIGQFPAGLQAQYAQAVTLLGWEIAEGRICDVVSLLGVQAKRIQFSTSVYPAPLSPWPTLACSENSYSDGSSCATAPTASSAMLIQSANDKDTIRGVRQAQSPASVTSLQPASSSSNRLCNCQGIPQFFIAAFWFLIKSKWWQQKSLE